ncbi:MAG: hypothetical protein E6943_09270 [Actinomyces sp.]|nr:hypothetical protein [Actinomyces sp.]MDU1522346.1 hypothetical protein [Actinomyces sp.]MDU2984145.1 hypothetical protein [Actinomyces sp.]
MSTSGGVQESGVFSRLVKNRKAMVVAVCVAVVVALVVAIIGVSAYRSHAAHQARSEFDAAQSVATGAYTSLTHAISGGEQLYADSEGKVGDDDSSRADLRAALDEGAALTMPAAQSGTTRELADGAQSLNDSAGVFTAAADKIEGASDKVRAAMTSHSKDLMVAARDTLKAEVDKAIKVLSDTTGKVSDDATRVSAQKAVDEATALIGQADAVSGESADPFDEMSAKLTEATGQVKAAAQKVSDSHAAWKKAEEAKAAASEPAGGYVEPTYSEPDYTSGGGYVEPDYSAPAPAPSAPATGGNTGGGDEYTWEWEDPGDTRICFEFDTQGNATGGYC